MHLKQQSINHQPQSINQQSTNQHQVFNYQAVGNLELTPQERLGFFVTGNYDFSEEVNVEVLGHLFERSITELEKLRVGGLFALKANLEAKAEYARWVYGVDRREIKMARISGDVAFTPAEIDFGNIQRAKRPVSQSTFSTTGRSATGT